MQNEVMENMKSLLQKKQYKSNFDFTKYNIDDYDKAYIIAREQKIFENAKKYSSSLYEICKALYEVKMTLKGDESQSFVEWYTCNGLTKDKVSELTKRFELYIQVPDKIDFISGLSIPAVKALTKKNVDVDVQIEAIEMGLRNVEDIQEFVSENSVSSEKKEKKEKKEIRPSFKIAFKMIDYYEKNINSNTPNSELANYKKEVADIKKYLKSIEQKIEELENQKTNENNLRLEDMELLKI